MKKIVKIAFVNIAIMAALLVLLESFCQMDKRYGMIKIAPKDSSVQSRMKNLNLGKESVSKELGSSVFGAPPSSHQSKTNEDLSHFSYADIDRTPVAKRSWTFENNGITRSSRFIRKIRGTDKIIFDVKYSLLPNDKRYVEGQDNKKKTEFFVVAAGDSFTFGEGVTQGQDYPSTLASMLGPEWAVYNYGVTGESANDLVARSTYNQEYFLPVKEKEGVFIWVYHDVQMQRLIFPSTAYKNASYIADKPDYSLEGDSLVFHGFFKNSNNPIRPLVNFLGDLALTETFNLEFPKVYTEKNFQLFFTLLNSSMTKFMENNQRIKKKILVTYTAHIEYELLKSKAEENGFEVLDIEKILYLRDKRFGGDLTVSIPVDGHPSPEAYWLLSTSLKEKYFK